VKASASSACDLSRVVVELKEDGQLDLFVPPFLGM
jgi:hypothetical protein